MHGPLSVTLPISFVQIPASAGGLTLDNILPWRIDTDIFEQAISHVNWDTVFDSSSAIMNGWKLSSGAQNAEISFDVFLAAGTWDVELLYVKDPASGIFSIQFDSVEKGTVDSYAAATAYNNRSTVSGITVTTSAKVRLTLKMATKNASSSSYYGRIQHIQLRRTDVGDAITIYAVDPDTNMPWLEDINTFMTPISHVNWNTNTVSNSAIRNGWRESSGAQNDEMSFDLILTAGTWDVELLYIKDSSNGIFSVQFDGIEKGTIDSYAAAVSYNNRTTVSGIATVTSGKMRLTLKMATKNVSSTSYFGEIQHIQLRRTV